MPLSTPQLSRATVGQPVSAAAWNALIDGVNRFYDAVPTVGHEYVRVIVSFRQGPVPGARVVAAPVAADGTPTGPPVEGATDGGDGTEFRIPAPAPGRWAFYVQAPGFAPHQTTVDIPAVVTPGPIATVNAEMAIAQRFVPDIVGLSVELATTWLWWAGFGRGVAGDVRLQPDGTRTHALNIDGTVLLQSPGAGLAQRVPVPTAAMNPAANVNLVYQLFAQPADPYHGKNAPWRTIVPDFLGYPASRLAALVNRGLKPPAVAGGSHDLAVVAQQPAAGTVVAVDTAFTVTLDDGDRATIKLGKFAGTHRKLADMPARTLADRVAASPLASAMSFGGWGFAPPWTLARRLLGNGELESVRRFFEDELEVKVTAEPGVAVDPAEGFAAAWQSLHVAAIVKAP